MMQTRIKGIIGFPYKSDQNTVKHAGIYGTYKLNM